MMTLRQQQELEDSKIMLTSIRQVLLKTMMMKSKDSDDNRLKEIVKGGLKKKSFKKKIQYDKYMKVIHVRKTNKSKRYANECSPHTKR